MKNILKNKTSRSNSITFLAGVLLFVLMLVLNSAGVLTRSLVGQLVPICAYIIMALALNLVTGILGELSLGHAGFMSLGAFSGVIVVSVLRTYISSSFALMLIAMCVGAIIAAISGAIIGIPALRLKGDYLAIVTLAFGEIIKNVVNCLYVYTDNGRLFFRMFTAAKSDTAEYIIRGPIGATVPEKYSTFALAGVVTLIILLLMMNYVNSREGRAIKAIRDNNIAAESVGLNLTAYKMKAFVVSAAISGIAGVLFAMNYSAVEARKFDFNASISILVMVVLGGMGNIPGACISAIILTILPQVLRGLDDFRMLIYALILILVMVLKPKEKIQSLLLSRKGDKANGK